MRPRCLVADLVTRDSLLRTLTALDYGQPPVVGLDDHVCAGRKYGCVFPMRPLPFQYTSPFAGFAQKSIPWLRSVMPNIRSPWITGELM